MLILQLAEDADAQTIAQLAEYIGDVNIALPMYKKVRKVLVSDHPLPVANGIKVQRQKLKKLIEEGKWSYRVLNLTQMCIRDRRCTA